MFLQNAKTCDLLSSCMINLNQNTEGKKRKFGHLFQYFQVKTLTAFPLKRKVYILILMKPV